MNDFNDCWYNEVCGRRAERCEATCARYHEMKYLMDNSNIPKNKQLPMVLKPSTCDLEAFRRLADIKANIVEFVEQGTNIYIMSNHVGNGKTSWAIKLMLKYFDSIWDGNGFRVRGVFVHVPTFLMKCKDFKSTDTEFEELKKNILTADLVIWDDLASTGMSSYDFTQLVVYMDARSLNGLSNIITGNLTTREDMLDSIGAKLTSRLWAKDTEVIEFKGGDRR